MNGRKVSENAVRSSENPALRLPRTRSTAVKSTSIAWNTCGIVRQFSVRRSPVLCRTAFKLMRSLSGAGGGEGVGGGATTAGAVEGAAGRSLIAARTAASSIFFTLSSLSVRRQPGERRARAAQSDGGRAA